MVILVIIVFIITFSILSTSMRGLTTGLFDRRLEKLEGKPEQLGDEFPRAFSFAVNVSWMALLLAGLAFVVAGFLVTDVFVERFFLILSAIVVPFVVGRNFSENTEPKVLREGFEKTFGRVLKSGTNADVAFLGRQGMAFSDPEFKAFVVEILSDWGGPTAYSLLDEMVREGDLPPDMVQPLWLKEAKVAKGKIKEANEAAEGGDAATFESLSQDYIFYQRLGKLTFHSSPEDLDAFLKGLPKGKDRYPFHIMQRKLMEAHPHVFCKKCRSRGEIRENEHYGVVFCRRCGRSEDLVTGVERVVGVVGEGEDWKMREGRLEVQLWDAESKQARYAEVDELRFEGLETKEAEWAIAGIHENFLNYFPSYKLPVVLNGGVPEGLSSNAQRQLAALAVPQEEAKRLTGE